jgi:hypothetical protein
MAGASKHKLMETIVFKEFAAKPLLCANLRLGLSATMRKPVAAVSRVLIAAALSAPLILAGAHNEALAKPSAAQRACNAKLGRCQAACTRKWTDAQFQNSCFRRCDVDFSRCSAKAAGGSKKETDPDPLRPKGTGDRTPPTGGTKAEPKSPPKVNDTRAPTGGANDQPKSPPKVNDTRAPIGGGVFHPKTSGAGSSGTILMSGEKPAPGAGVPKSGNGRR